MGTWAMAAGCSLTSTDGFVGGADASPDASGAGSDGAPSITADATSEATGVPADAGPPNVLSNGDFELGCSDGWKGLDPFTTGTLDTTAHSGSASCRVCSTAFDGGGATFYADFGQSAEHPVAPGETYEAELWARTAPSSAAPDSFSAALAVRDADGGALEETNSGAQIPTDAWAHVGFSHKTTAAGETLSFIITMQRNSGTTTCLLLDDARISKRSP
jgi:hypothetical protein